MKVKLRQFELDTNEMSAFHTGVDSMPIIFVSPGGATFVQTSRPHWPEPRIRHLGRAEALRLANFYNLPELRDRLTQRNYPCPTMPPMGPAAYSALSS